MVVKVWSIQSDTSTRTKIYEGLKENNNYLNSETNSTFNLHCIATISLPNSNGDGANIPGALMMINPYTCMFGIPWNDNLLVSSYKYSGK